MQADQFETDQGLDLIKEYDPDGDRTLGILTKVDLMNTDTDISDYLLNKVSKDLLFKYGFILCKKQEQEKYNYSGSTSRGEGFF